jgi:hypothetical protein
VLPFVKSLQSAVDQSHFIKNISGATGIREDALITELKKVTPAVVTAEARQERPPLAQNIERKIFAALYLSEQKASGKKLREQVQKILGEKKMKELESVFEKEKSELLLEAEILYETEQSVEHDSKELLKRLEEDILKAQYQETMKELKIAEQSKDQKRITELVERCKEIANKLSILRHQ